MESFEYSARVIHPTFGQGEVILDQNGSVVVRFDHGIEECLSVDLEKVENLSERMVDGHLDPALYVITRILGECILSVNNAWGVFSRSRIELLPHQLWVCKRVLESWPTRWLVADDVGLGKTIEAGLILTPLLSSGRVQRLLVVAPSSLVEQWQVRLREMFDIRLSIYVSSADTETSDYWNTHNQVVASVQTLRLDTDGRWKHLFDAGAWDLVFVDEAHHMNVEDDGHRTLSYQLVEQLQKRNKIQSLVLFTGTPHRGKDKGFLSLLKLLRPDKFNPDQPLVEQVQFLRTVMIRNNKQSVTDMSGKQLFTPVKPRQETYTYSSQEDQFYKQLTHFIVEGKAYAAYLGKQDSRTVMLVLITMQKLASSSVAAVRRALTRRLSRLQQAKIKLDGRNDDLVRLEELQNEGDSANFDQISELEERIAESAREVRLNPNEIPELKKLLDIANRVIEETKINRILAVVDESFADRSVLFFTEYKATQALLMSALHKRYGDDCVTFINGDNSIEDVEDSLGNVSEMKQDRQQSAKLFNQGKVRFLVSTEAAGEGIDLQHNCSTLIHVDLPWNPMRLHQRVGRLSRYGQTNPVDVVTVRNPDTVESRIWKLLDEKLDRVNLAFQNAMEDPEDIRQLIIGMASPKILTKVFSEADASLSEQTLSEWFDETTATFGGEDAVLAVRNLVGHVARFDFGVVADQIPRVDLSDMLPFMSAILAVRGRRPERTGDDQLRFRPPDEWKDEFTIAGVEHYDLLFSRELQPNDREDVAGVGLQVVDRAIRDSVTLTGTLGTIRGLNSPIFIFCVRDRITGSDSPIRKIVVAAKYDNREQFTLIRDWELIQCLNRFADKPRSSVLASQQSTFNTANLLLEARQYVESQLETLKLNFNLPILEDLACLVPEV